MKTRKYAGACCSEEIILATIFLFVDYLICEVSLKMNPASLEYQEVLISHRTINNPLPPEVRSTFKVQSSQ